jgi:hypothetical protein
VQEHLVNGRPVKRLRLADECINTKSCPHRPIGESVRQWNSERWTVHSEQWTVDSGLRTRSAAGRFSLCTVHWRLRCTPPGPMRYPET